MGLDQYAYVANKDNSEYISQREIAYWRKHPNLQGWMHNLWTKKGEPGKDPKYPEFNGIELELTWEDIDQLATELALDNLVKLNTTGFFFGDANDDYYREDDLRFISQAKAELFMGFRVFYNSSW